MNNNFLLALLCLEAAPLLLLPWLMYRRKKREEAARWAARQLHRNLEALQVQAKTLVQQDAWHPGDPKVIFMAAHLQAKLQRHNELARRMAERLKS